MAFLGRSWELAKACFHVLRRDKEILLFPLIAGVVIVAALLVLVTSLFISPMLFIWLLILAIFLGPIFFAFLGVLMEAAVVGCATIRLQGGDPKIRDGLKIAAKNWWPLLQWAFIGIIIGIILSFIRGLFRRPAVTRGGLPGAPRFPLIRSSPLLGGNLGSHLCRSYKSTGFTGPELGIPGPDWGIGDILAGVLGMAWAVATFFVIPVMIYEKLSPFKAIKRSVEIIRNVWKETLILKFGFKAIFALLGGLGIVFIVLGVLTGVTFVPIPQPAEATHEIVVTNAPALIAGFAVAIAWWAVLGCINFAMKGILKAALYEYSRIGQREPSAQLPQAEEFNPLNNVIRSLQRETPAEAYQPPPSAADEIKKLAELRDKGIITEEEFQEKKRKLLEKI